MLGFSQTALGLNAPLVARFTTLRSVFSFGFSCLSLMSGGNLGKLSGIL